MKKNSWMWTFLVSGGHFWVDYYQNMLIPLLPFITLLWGLNNSQLALLVSLQSMTANLMQPFFGYFMDRYPRKWSLGFGLLIIALPMCFLYLTSGYLSFMILVIIAGVGSALYHPLGAKKVVEGVDGEKALKMSVYSALGSFGFGISPAITAFMVSVWGMEGLAVMVIPAVLWVILLKWGNPAPGTEEGSHVTQEAEVKTSDPVKLSEYKPIFLLSCIVGCRSWLVTATNVFIPLWLVTQGSSEKAAGLHLTIYLLAGTVGGLFYGMLYKKIRPDLLLVTSFILSMLLLPVYFYVEPAFRIAVLILLGVILRGTSPLTVVIGQELLPRQAAFASGITMGLAFGLGGMGVSLTGLCADVWGEVTALLLSTIVLLPAIIITVYLSRLFAEKKRTSYPAEM